ncbi:hypothetical protein, variant [Batrachochytrium dendrobatidis JEL423]|nr:hypothetical protein, variant [Batrachochytrium dendrobatidis JEL423]
MPLFSIMSGRLVDKYGPRIVCICGAFITLASLILASFSTQLWHFLVTQGFLFGLGSSTAYLPSLAVLSDWWVKHRGLATGMAVAGAGIGGLAWGPVLRALITHIGWRWTLRIAGIASFVIVMVGAILLRIRLPRKAAASIDLSYFRESIFLRLYATTFITTFAYFIPFFFIPSYAINHGLSREQGALLLGLLNGASGLGRIALGFVADYLGCTNVMTSCLGLSATVILCVWPFATTFESLLALVIFFGFFVGGYISLLSTVTAQLFGSRGNIGSITGMIYNGLFFGSLFGAPIGGAMIDHFTVQAADGTISPNFLPSIMFSGSCFAAGAMLAFSVKYSAGGGKIFIKI